ncbi:MAG TPA: Lrp/AsnC family transcriptional regulator [Candidatus Thermoplasmatota archaeon]|nr:Lrp/AsnC family transcriptional regulator [Candidatus Thermoplasmatota archaeon]
MKIDTINKKILYLLQKDARMTYKEIATELNRSETTIRDRIKAMERIDIIQGYTALINKTALGLNFFAILLINPVSSSEIDSITQKIKKVKNVVRLYEISGHHRLAVFMVAPSYAELKKIVNKQLLPIGLKDEEIITVLEADTEFISPLEIP